MKKLTNEQRIYVLEKTSIMFAFALLFITGALMNMAAITFNGGKMPVLTSYDINDKMYFSTLDEDELNYPQLVDRINFFDMYIASIGDLVMLFSGLCVILLSGYTLYKQIKWKYF